MDIAIAIAVGGAAVAVSIALGLLLGGLVVNVLMALVPVFISLSDWAVRKIDSWGR